MSPVAHPVGAGVPDGPFSVLRLRAAPASCICLRRPYFFQQRKKYGKERRQKPTVFGFPFRPIVTAVQKGSAPNRLHSYPRCRSCVPRGGARRSRQLSLNWHRCRSCVPRLNAPMGTPRPHVSRHVSGRAPRRGRRPRRPVFRSPIAGCTRVLHLPPAAIFLSTAKEIWKRTPPKTDGFWISLSSNCNCGAKRFRKELPPRLSPLPLPRTARKLSSLVPYRGSALHPTYFYILRPEGPHLSITVRRKTPPVPASRV